MPITWNNINAPQFGAANLLSQSAGNRISDSVQQLSALAGQQASDIRTENAKVKTENTDAILNQINSLGSMDAYNQALQEGTFSADTLTQQYGKQYDAKSVLAALQSRDNQLMQDETDAFNYQTTLTKRADTPILESMTEDIYKAKDVASLQKILDGLDNSNLSNAGQSTVAKAITDQITQLNNLAYQQSQRNWEQEQRARTRKEWYEEDKAKYVTEYKQEDQLKTNVDLASIQTTIEGLDKKYPVPADLGDPMNLGTGLDAIAEYVSGTLDGNTLNAGDITDEIIAAAKGKKFTATLKNPDGTTSTQEYDIRTVPKWVMQQALKENPVNPNLIFEWGNNDLGSGQAAKIVKSVEAAMKQFGIYYNNQQTREQLKSNLNAQQLQLKIKQLRLISEAETSYDAMRKNKTTKGI